MTFFAKKRTRMHSRRMCTVCCSGHLSCHAPLPCMPPATHASLPLPHKSHHHACPLLCMPPATHAPLPCHACPPPPATHAPTMHAPNMHTPFSIHATPVDRMTDVYEYITFPQLLLRSVKIYVYVYYFLYAGPALKIRTTSSLRHFVTLFHTADPF